MRRVLLATDGGPGGGHSVTADIDVVDDDLDPEDIVQYFQERPVNFYEAIDFTLADTQRRILEAIQEHDRILVLSGNGTGKTAGVTMAAYHFWVTNWNALVLFTSGNYDILRDTSWPFMQTIHQEAQRELPVPGRTKQSPPRMEIDDYPEWFLRYASPRHPENLQGRHARRAMVVIEEADKPDVTAAHFDAATSTARSADDVVVAVANPPTERSNVVYSKMESERWEVIQFSSFDSHNVIQTGADPLMLDAEDLHGDPASRQKIGGLVDMDVITEDFGEWHGRRFDGVDAVQDHVRYDPDAGYWKANEDLSADLDPRWYRTRLGVMPPSGQGTLRPWYERHVDEAVERWRQKHGPRLDRGWARQKTVHQLGADIARGGGDRTVCVARYADGTLRTLVDQETGDHTRNRDLLENAAEQVSRGPSFRFLVDAVGEGSGVADELRRRVTGVKRFEAGANAADDEEYYDARTEALVELGDRLKTGLLVPPNSTLERELRAGARTLELEERSLRENTVLRVSGKDDLRDPSRLGRSPDVLDAAMLAAYTAKYSGDAVVINPGGVVG